jgi:hypothetical protein
MDSSLFKNLENFPDWAPYRAKVPIFENMGLNFKAQACVSLPRPYSSVLTLVNFSLIPGLGIVIFVFATSEKL